MKRWLRLLLMSLLAMSVAAQAIAAAAMIPCSVPRVAAAPHGGLSASAAHVHAVEHHHANPLDSGGHHHHSAKRVADKGSCSVCAACCLSAAMPPAMPVVATAAGDECRHSIPAGGVAVFVTGGPDRPPRLILG